MTLTNECMDELCSEDVRAAVNACRAKYPAAPILLAGYSLGTYVIATYLAEEDSKRPAGDTNGHGVGAGGLGAAGGSGVGARAGAVGGVVAGVVLISSPLDPHSSHSGLRQGSVHHKLLQTTFFKVTPPLLTRLVASLTSTVSTVLTQNHVDTYQLRF